MCDGCDFGWNVDKYIPFLSVANEWEFKFAWNFHFWLMIWSEMIVVMDRKTNNHSSMCFCWLTGESCWGRMRRLFEYGNGRIEETILRTIKLTFFSILA